eukprot:3939830-Prymnesium_polylepis.1
MRRVHAHSDRRTIPNAIRVGAQVRMATRTRGSGRAHTTPPTAQLSVGTAVSVAAGAGAWVHDEGTCKARG